jgi:hypothetical protein
MSYFGPRVGQPLTNNSTIRIPFILLVNKFKQSHKVIHYFKNFQFSPRKTGQDKKKKLKR